MIPASTTSALALLNASVQAVTPVAQATPLLKAALVNAGQGLVTSIDAALTSAAGALDAPDPAGFAGDLVTDLLALSTAADDQAALADMRGTVGRAVFNLAQA